MACGVAAGDTSTPGDGDAAEVARRALGGGRDGAAGERRMRAVRAPRERRCPCALAPALDAPPPKQDGFSAGHAALFFAPSGHPAAQPGQAASLAFIKMA